MAGVRFVGRTTSAVQTGTSRKTVYQVVAASNHRDHVHRIAVTFADGVDPTDTPVLVEFIIQSDAGSGSTADNPAKIRTADDETLQTTAIRNCTSLPTNTRVLHNETVIPYGSYEWTWSRAEPLVIGGGERLGVTITSGVDYAVRVTVEGEE